MMQKKSLAGQVTSWPGALIAGFGYPLRALRIINRSRHLWRYVLLPVVINLGLGMLLYATLFVGGLNMIDQLLADLPSWLAFIDVLLQALLVVLLLMIVGFVLLRFGVVLGSPWYSQLSERLEEDLTGRPVTAPPLRLGTLLGDIGRALSFEGKKLLLLLLVAIPLIILDFIPPFGPLISTVGWIVLLATIACLDMVDPALSRHRLRFRAKLGLLRYGLPATASFALTCLVLISIPFANLLAIPLCVAAGTLFVCERLHGQVEAKRPPA